MSSNPLESHIHTSQKSHYYTTNIISPNLAAVSETVTSHVMDFFSLIVSSDCYISFPSSRFPWTFPHFLHVWVKCKLFGCITTQSRVGENSVHLHESDYTVNIGSRQPDLFNKEKNWLQWNPYIMCCKTHRGFTAKSSMLSLFNKMLHSALRTLIIMCAAN